MKKLAMSAVFLMLLFGSAVAHNGALSLYTDIGLSSCSMNIEPFAQDTINMYYVRGTGPDLGNAVEFRLEASIPDALILSTDWNSQINMTLGDVSTGISLTASQCLGQNESVVFIGAIGLMYAGADAGVLFAIMVKEDPTVADPPGPGIYVTECVTGNPMVTVLGGTFVFNGSCDTGVQQTSWGAIKSLYK
ncbi:MAG: hypothetical protein NTW97_04780 [Candidatus Krumholzibacteria bacterium]|nr:hypothetical protein [Candidatus Krumholzibacteria bacterium]